MRLRVGEERGDDEMTGSVNLCVPWYHGIMVYCLCCAGGATTCMPCLHVMPYSYSYNYSYTIVGRACTEPLWQDRHSFQALPGGGGGGGGVSGVQAWWVAGVRDAVGGALRG